MADPIVNVDPRIYGGDAPTGNAVPEFDPMGFAPGAQEAQAPAPERVSQDKIGEGTLSATVGQNTAAQNAREVSSMGTSALAAVKSWSPVRVWDYVNKPAFDRDPNFDSKPYVNSVPFTMSEDEQRFLAQSVSVDDFNYRLQNTKEQRDLYQQMGDHPLLSTLVAMADPGYLALDLASFGVATGATALGASLRTARVASGLTAAASTFSLGVVQGQVVPMSDTEILLPALMSGAAAGMFYRPKKGMTPHDTAYPSDDLRKAVQDIQGQSSGVEKRVAAEARDVAESTPTVAKAEADTAGARTTTATASEVDAEAARAGRATTEPPVKVPGAQVGDETVGAELRTKGVRPTDPTTDAYQYLAQFENDAEFGPMIRTLREEQPDLLGKLKVIESDGLVEKGRPFYSSGSHSVHMPSAAANTQFRGAMQTLHEVMHGLTVHKLNYGLAVPDSAHGKITKQLIQIMNEAKTEFQKVKDTMTMAQQHQANYFINRNIREFVAGLYSGESGGLPRLLANMPSGVAGKPNMLSRLSDTVRKLLGIPPKQNDALNRALGLTDELMNTKLNVKVHDNSVVPGMTLIDSAPSMGAAPTGTQSQQAATIVKRMEGAAAKTGNAISWSLHKTMSKLGSAGKKVADLLVDDPVNMTGDSVVSQKQAIRSDLVGLQYVYEDALKDEMAVRGAGLKNRLLKPRESAEIQRGIEREVYDELQRRNNVVRRGGNINDPSVNPAIAKMADAHDRATAAALREMKSAGVLGADVVEEAAGYTPRKWSVTRIESAENALQMSGLTEKQARVTVRDLVKDAIKRANPDWEDELAQTVGSAIIDRARRKGYFEDQALRGHVGDAGAKEIRDILESSGASKANIQRAIEVITGVTDEAGKSANLKHRIAMDTTASIRTADGQAITVADLLDTNVARNLDTYLDNAAGNSALARKGLHSTGEIADLRTEYLHGIANEADRKVAAGLFDNTIASIKGQPVGEDLHDGMRKLAAVTQMVGLSSSGLWQVTEYANAMAKYGLIKTTKEIMRTLPVFRALMHNPAAEGGAESLANILARNSAQDLRIRPYIQKLEDNFEMDMGDHVMLVAQQSKQLVPYINAMHYIHHNQARVVGNLVADVFKQGAEGSAKAREALAKYGLEGHTLDSVASDIKAHGMNTGAWSDATWQQVRGPLSKMMDDAVLKNRTGEIPAFAQFSSVGKFIFTFRSFVLGAHNKVLAGTLGREGFGGMGLLMAYQFPLTMLASSANAAMKGQPQPDLGKLASTSLSQMGAMGMFSDLWGIASGDKQQFGASGLMAIDRLYKTGSAVATGNFGTAASGAVNSIPLLSIVPGVKAFAETLKDDPNHKQ